MPTRAGWTVLGAGASLGVAGLALGWVELLLLASVAAAALATGVVWVLRTPRLAVVQHVEPVRVGVGGDAAARIEVRNVGRLPSAETVAEEPCGDGVVDVPVPRLGAGRDTAVGFGLPTERRCVMDVGPLRLVRRDPFGLYRREVRSGDAATLWVHPRRFPIVPQPSGRSPHLDGPVSDRSPAGTITFHTIREYVQGDDLRFIHWKSTARTGTLMVRQHVDTARPYTAILVDVRSGAHTAHSFEVAMEAAASIADVCVGHNFPVRILTTGGDVVGGPQDPAPLSDYLDMLAGLQPAEVTDVSASVAGLGGGTRGACLTLVAGVVAGDDRGVLAVARRRFDRATIVDVRPDHDGGIGPFLADATYLPASSGLDFASRWNGAFR